jgi:hypothetical protein
MAALFEMPSCSLKKRSIPWRVSVLINVSVNSPTW